jgi:hypothetical protein
MVGSTVTDMLTKAPSGALFIARVAPKGVSGIAFTLPVSVNANFAGPVSESSTKVAGKHAVRVTYSTHAGGFVETIELVVVPLGGGLAYTFTLEAPQARWHRAYPQLQQVLDSVRLDPTKIAKAG